MLLTAEYSNLTRQRQGEKDASASRKDDSLWTLVISVSWLPGPPRRQKMEVSSTNVPLLFTFLLFCTLVFEMYIETKKKEIFTCVGGY